ncbi:MAG: glycosyltransferase family 2 protein [Candidatus Omnitrophica bacterium]|nr:glycosyltransferase family 2 protein [Candidatus Omnitrophota bacterium]
MKTTVKSISIVIPVYNEEDSLRELWKELSAALKNLPLYEVIFINDGSTDHSSSILTELAQENPKVVCIAFRKNFGKSEALSTGFRTAAGEVVVTLDADLQDDPQEIPRLLQKLEEGYDLVSAWREKRRDPFLKKHTSKLFNCTTALVTGLPLHDFNCCLKCYRRDVVKELKLYGQLHRFIPALAYWKGFRVGEIKVNHRERRHGKTKYGPARYLEGFLDLLTVLLVTKYLKRPLHFLGRPGLVSGAIGFLICVYLTVLWFTGHGPIGNRPLLFLGILLILSGIQFFCVGLLGELIVHASHENPLSPERSCEMDAPVVINQSEVLDTEIT